MKNSQNKLWLFLAIFSIVFIYIWFSYRLNLSLIFDEAYTIYFSQSYKTIADDTWPPLYYAIVYTSRLLGAYSEWSIRLLSVFATIALGTIIFLYGRFLFGNKVTLFALLGVVLSPVVIRYAFWARGYSLLIVFSALVSLTTTSLALRGPTKYRMFSWATACWLLAATHHFGTILAISSYLILRFAYFRDDAAKKLQDTAFILLCSLSPLFITNVRQLLLGVRAITAIHYIQLEQVIKLFAPSSAIPVTATQMIVGLLLLILVIYGSKQNTPKNKVSFNTSDNLDSSSKQSLIAEHLNKNKVFSHKWILPFLGMMILYVAVFVFCNDLWPKASSWAAILTTVALLGLKLFDLVSVRSSKLKCWSYLRTIHPLALLLAITLIIASLISIIIPIANPRNLLILLPGYWLLAAYGFFRLSKNKRLVVAAILTLSLIASLITFEQRFGRHENWREAIAIAKNLLKPMDDVSIRPFWGSPILTYYGINNKPLMLNRGNEICKLPASVNHVVILSSQWHHVYGSKKWQRRFEQEINNCAEIISTVELDGVKVQRVKIKSKLP
ncbi:MAG: hypothetical protein JW841_06310 [Deltaproteobacteria bacterium]|nr:hypothetical protein [Deltaproteobacteria bacterium]